MNRPFTPLLVRDTTSRFMINRSNAGPLRAFKGRDSGLHLLARRPLEQHGVLVDRLHTVDITRTPQGRDSRQRRWHRGQ